MKWLLPLMTALLWLVMPADASGRSGPHATSACIKIDDVDSCWKAGAEAERHADQAAAFAAYERSCAAGFIINGCYDAGKIAFLNPELRDYALARARMTRVCKSDDMLIGPYACTYLGIMEQEGLGGSRQPRASVFSFAGACFLQNRDHYIDGRGCALLAETFPGARAINEPEVAWPPDYIRYLAYAMGCTDAMPDLCVKAQTILKQALASSAAWLPICEDQLAGRPPAGTCALLAEQSLSSDFDDRQRLLRKIAGLFREVTSIHDQ